jgi:hypothetical protein
MFTRPTDRRNGQGQRPLFDLPSTSLFSRVRLLAVLECAFTELASHPSRHFLRYVIEYHQMTLFDYQVGKHGGLPSGFLVSRGHALRDVQFLK